MDTKISQRMNRPLRGSRSGNRRSASRGRAPPGHRPRTDPLGKFRFRSRARSHGLGAHQQIRRGLSRQALLRRLRIRGPRRATGDRPRQGSCFGAEHANVQSHSGTQANVSVYMAALQPGDTVLGMNLAHGGHLTHGHPLNFSGKMYKFIPYGVSKETETIDYDELERLAQEHKPKMIVAGASAYSRIIDFPRMAEIARVRRRAFLRGHGAHRGPGRRRACIRARCRTPISFPPPRTRRCAARAAAWCCASSNARRNSTASRSPARRAAR